MANQSKQFKSRAHDALADKQLQQALAVIPEGFVGKRSKAKAAFKDFDELSNRAVAIKNYTLANLDKYLEQFENAVIKSGGSVHFANQGEDARQIITEICKTKDARLIAKGKTMVGEEIGLTQHLEEEGFETVETDLGEYLIQLRHEIPSHIIAPAVHLTREKIRDDFLKTHTDLPKDRPLDTPEDFVKEARGILREKFVNADIGITGANFIIADTGSTIIVTNEGNGDLCSSLPKTHIVITSIEKLVPTFADAAVMLRLLARSATGQSISTYTTLTTGPERKSDNTAPEFHIILLDNGRSEMLGSKFHEMLRCIRCGACLNHCPVYQNLGGHAYGSVYPGPMGAVLSPQYFGDHANELPFASSFCGRCNEVCPMQIPLTKLMRHWREDATEGSREESTPRRHISSTTTPLARLTMKLWASLAKRPRLYNVALKIALPVIAVVSRQQSLISKIPGTSAWLQHRDLPQIAAKSFQTQWQIQKNLQGKLQGKAKRSETQNGK